MIWCLYFMRHINLNTKQGSGAYEVIVFMGRKP